MARESKKSDKRGGIGWKLWLGAAAAAMVCVSTAVAALKVHDYVLSDSQFKLSRYQKDALVIHGIRYASRSKVQHAFAHDFDRSVFAAPLEERRRRLLAVDWVEDASISRIWPDRLVVRIHERTPVAFVYFRAGVLLIDANGVLLDPPAQEGGMGRFSFPVLSGVREDESEADREQRVRAMLRVQEDLGYMAKDVSEVNAADLENLRVIAKAGDRAVELILGDTNFGQRFQNFLTHYPEIRKQSPEVKTFDLRLDDRITAKE
jgi:cell division protein FtsQ